MEKIKKIIERKLVFIKSDECENCVKLVSDTGTTYNFKINLTENATDIGFFDVSDVDAIND